MSQLLLAETNTTATCELVSSQPFGYAGDVGGKRIYTKQEYVYECTDTKEKRTSCKTWEIQKEMIDVSQIDRTIYYQSENFQGSMGEMLAVVQGYDKINGLWSGWKGMCQDGVDDGNWDWADDPYFWAGMALDVLSAGAASEASSAAKSANDLGMSVRVAKKIKEAAEVVQYATCAARASLSVSQMLENFYADDGVECDPFDEICNDDSVDESGGNIFTIPESKYNDLVENTPEVAEYLLVIENNGAGVLTVKMIKPTSQVADTSTDEAKEAVRKQKETALKTEAAMMTFQLAACIVGATEGGGGGSADGGADSDIASTKNIVTSVVGAYNPLVGAAVTVVWNVYDSVTSDVDTCNDRDDAKAKGKRQEATYDSKAYGMCHFIEKEGMGKPENFNVQTMYYYCCYDDPSTRMIVEQVKAQFGKNWVHCTDISLTELSLVSFSSCDPDELDSSVNGVNLPANATQAERNQAYQLTNKCIDTREYMAHLLKTFGGPDMLIDTTDIEEILEDLK